MSRFVLQRLPRGMQAGKDDKTAMADLFGLFKQHYQTLSTAFMYYSCGGSSDTFHMSLNQFTSFLEDCKVCTLARSCICACSTCLSPAVHIRLPLSLVGC